MNQFSVDPAGFGEPAHSAFETGDRAFSFAGFSLEPDGTLFRGGTLIHLPPRELAALRLLLEHAGRVVTSQQLRDALWGDIHVSPDSVTRCVSSLRARLDLEPCIQTVYKRGYRFAAGVAVHPAAAPGPLPRLAIMPFAAGFDVPEYLGFAVAEETAAALTLARHPAVSVLAQDSVAAFARRGLTANQTGAALKADLVLSGTLRALPSNYRLGVELIRVSDGVQVWAEDVLVPRRRIAGLELELAARLNLRLLAALPTSLPATPPAQAKGLSIAASADFAAPGRQDAEDARLRAYEMFQSARHEWQNFQRHRMQESLDHLRRAIELDPSLVGARVDLANLCVAQAIYGFMAPAAAAATARNAAEPVAGLPGRAAALLPALGWIGFHYDHDLPAALSAFEQSAHLPHDPGITRARTFFSLSRHRFDEAIHLLREAIALDPISACLHGRLAWALHLAGRAEESLAQARQVLDQFPQESASSFYASLILAWNGEADRAAKVAQELETHFPQLDLALAAHAYALARAGKKDEARAVLEQLEWRARERFTVTGFNAAVYVELGAPGEALKVLRESMESRCPWFFQMLADPRLKPLPAHPEFEELRAALAKMEAEQPETGERH